MALIQRLLLYLLFQLYQIIIRQDQSNMQMLNVQNDRFDEKYKKSQSIFDMSDEVQLPIQDWQCQSSTRSIHQFSSQSQSQNINPDDFSSSYQDSKEKQGHQEQFKKQEQGQRQGQFKRILPKSVSEKIDQCQIQQFVQEVKKVKELESKENINSNENKIYFDAYLQDRYNQIQLINQIRQNYLQQTVNDTPEDLYQCYKQKVFPSIEGNLLKIREQNPKKIIQFLKYYKLCFNHLNNSSAKIPDKIEFIQLKASWISSASSSSENKQQQKCLRQFLSELYQFRQICLSLVEIDDTNFVIPKFLKTEIIHINYNKNLKAQNFQSFPPRIKQIYLGLIDLCFLQKFLKRCHPDLQIFQFSLNFTDLKQAKEFISILTKYKESLKWRNGEQNELRMKINIHTDPSDVKIIDNNSFQIPLQKFRQYIYQKRYSDEDDLIQIQYQLISIVQLSINYELLFFQNLIELLIQLNKKENSQEKFTSFTQKVKTKSSPFYSVAKKVNLGIQSLSSPSCLKVLIEYLSGNHEQFYQLNLLNLKQKVNQIRQDKIELVTLQSQPVQRMKQAIIEYFTIYKCTLTSPQSNRLKLIQNY